MNRFLNIVLRPDWCVDKDGDPTLRLWGRFGITFYKWPDAAIFQNAKDFKRVEKRGITAVDRECGE